MTDYTNSPARIVSLEPSITAMLAALGQLDRLVAVSQYCHHLVDVGDLPCLPSTWRVEPDDILQHEPDLVIASVPYSAESVTNLLQARLNVLCLYPQRLADVYQHIRWLGNLTAVPHRATEIINNMQIRLGEIEQLVNGRPRPRVFCEMWPKPLMCSVEWIAELVTIAGGEFVGGEPGSTVDESAVITADPELIILAWAGVESPSVEKVLAREGWEEVTAVRTRRVIAVDEILLNAPGSNLLRGAEQLLVAIHPELGVSNNLGNL